MAKEKGLAPIVIILPLVVVMVFVIVGLLAWQQYKALPQEPEQIACTMEAMICPDGSAVGRTGPNCEFAACPAPTTVNQPADSYDFVFKYFDAYTNVKAQLTASGWTPIIPPSTAAPIDPQFPEISSCGPGVDRICVVGFQKGAYQRRFNLQLRSDNGASEWIVVGSE